MSRKLLSLVVALVAAAVFIVAIHAAATKDAPAPKPAAPAAADPFGAPAPKPAPDAPDPFGSKRKTEGNIPGVDDPFGGDDSPMSDVVKPQAQKARPNANTPSAKPGPFTGGPLRAGEQAILKVLEEPTSLQCEETPLNEVMDYLRDKHHVASVFDKKALDDMNISVDTPVTSKLPEIPLRAALDLILNGLGLTWTIKSDVLLITTPERAESHLVTKTYEVVDLITPTLDYPYRGAQLPTVMQDESRWDGLYPQVGSGMGAAGSAGGGMGMFSVPSDAAAPPSTLTGKPRKEDYLYQRGSSRSSHVPGTKPADSNVLDYDSLIDLITSIIEPTTWDAVGGPGSIAPFGHSLVISQTLAVHRQIETLLADLRAKRLAAPTFVVDLQWLWLDAQQREQLLGDGKAASPGRAALAIDAKTLAEIARKAPGFRGRIACANSQLVHLASGDRRSTIVSAVPVVGSGIGYQPVIQVPNAGVILELRPTVTPGGDTAVLDVRSTVTRWGKQEPPVHVGAAWPPDDITEGATPPPAAGEGQPKPVPVPASNQGTSHVPAGSASCPVERPVMPAQQFAATIRVPLGKPVVLGAMTFSSADEAGLAQPGENPKQLCLIATTSVAATETGH